MTTYIGIDRETREWLTRVFLVSKGHETSRGTESAYDWIMGDLERNLRATTPQDASTQRQEES